jgi:hypothetical protein
MDTEAAAGLRVTCFLPDRKKHNGETHMTRGFLKSASVAALSLALSSTAYAADLGGNCCADLEERVAELEATVAKKGTRKVSLTVYGWVNKIMLHWDDGVQSNNYLGIDNTNSATRFGFRGDAAINGEWKAGYSILLDVASGARSGTVDQTGEEKATGGIGADDHIVRMRDANVWLESSRVGRFTLGRLTVTGPQGTIDLANLGNVASGSQSLVGGAFQFRANNATNAFTGVSLGAVSDNLADYNARVDGIRWDSPTWHGFVIGASIGEARQVDTNNGLTPPVNPGLGPLYAVNLRYAGEFNGVRVASAIGYEVSSNEETYASFGGAPLNVRRPDSKNFGTSSSMLHVATGLFIQGHYLRHERGNDDLSTDTAKAWLVQAGLMRNFFGIGNTSLYGEYSRVSNGFNTFGARATIGAAATNTDYRMWGLGVAQNVDAAAMQLYAGYRNHSVEWAAQTALGGAKDIGFFIAGARINF